MLNWNETPFLTSIKYKVYEGFLSTQFFAIKWEVLLLLFEQKLLLLLLWNK